MTKIEKLNDAFVEAMYQIMINTSDVATAEKAYENIRHMIKDAEHKSEIAEMSQQEMYEYIKDDCEVALERDGLRPVVVGASVVWVA
ncbi:hypothetical protein BN1222_03583 [Klebsiella quasipneumoniae]|uniref:hypothetical protein n=1 Tax=Klebsiella quasipneumoniae TaxID=1463165 RepID=UPI0005E683AA|nr:hypothetical protein [Klebsiella quasipneumoniae]CEL82321.1 hypothetical protein BN1222_03583 [Klebsiella quasipneumoniae]